MLERPALSALAEAGWRLTATTTSTRRVAVPGFLLDGMSNDRGRLLRSYCAGTRSRATSTTMGRWRWGCWSCTCDRGGALAGRGRTAVRARAVRRRRPGRLLLPPRTASGWSPATGAGRQPDPAGQSLVATALLKLGRLRGVDEWEVPNRRCAGAALHPACAARAWPGAVRARDAPRARRSWWSALRTIWPRASVGGRPRRLPPKRRTPSVTAVGDRPAAAGGQAAGGRRLLVRICERFACRRRRPTRVWSRKRCGERGRS